MKLDVATLLNGSTTTFALSYLRKSNTALNTFESEIGAQSHIGFFYILGMLADDNQERFVCLRYVEVQQSRITQLDFLRNIVNRNGIHLSGDIYYSGHPLTKFSTYGRPYLAQMLSPRMVSSMSSSLFGAIELDVYFSGTPLMR